MGKEIRIARHALCNRALGSLEVSPDLSVSIESRGSGGPAAISVMLENSSA